MPNSIGTLYYVYIKLFGVGIMAYLINHIHIRAKDPMASAAWYEKFFGTKVLSSREVMPGTITVSMDTGGPVRLNISPQVSGSSDYEGSAELNTLGLEHFGFSTDDIEADIYEFENHGVRVVLPITEVGSGTKLAYIEGPDHVLIELVQSAVK